MRFNILTFVIIGFLITLTGCEVKNENGIIQPHMKDTYMDEDDGKTDYGSSAYYVSNSTGNDSNDGKSPLRPWKSLERISKNTYTDGDRILLKCGDTWEGEALSLKGDGSKKKWILLSSYGKGDRPKVLPGKDSIWCVKIENSGGWMIKGIEVGEAQTGIVFWNSRPDASEDIWVEDCYIHDIEGAPVYPNNEVDHLVMSVGLFSLADKLGGMPYKSITVKDCTFEKTDQPIYLNSAERVLIEGCSIKDSYRQGVLFEKISTVEGNESIMKNCKVVNTGLKGMHWGVAGIQFNTCRNFILQDCEIGTVKSPDCPDGVGVDYEGTNINVDAKRCYIHDCDSSAFLIYKNSDWGRDNDNTSIIDCRIENNGLENPETTPAFLRHYKNETNGGTISGNTIIKASTKQFLNYIDEESPKLTEIMPKNYITSGNKAILPESQGMFYAPTGFSDEQGINQWHYMERVEGVYTEMKFEPLLHIWKGSDPDCAIGFNWHQPGVETDSVRKWTAPANGEIVITGHIKKNDPRGNGVELCILKNNDMIWGPEILESSSKEHLFNAIVQKGDSIYFTVNSKGEQSYDKIVWDAVIVYNKNK